MVTSAGPETGNHDFSGLKILLVEAEAQVARALQDSLSRRTGEFQVDHVSTLREAAGCLSRNAYDAAVMDLSLPDSQGAETYRQFRQAAPNLPVVVLAGQHDEDMGLRLLEDGAQDCLLKGEGSINHICRSVRYACARKELGRHREVEEEQRQARDQAQSANQAKSHFLASVSHELRTPLNSIIGFTEMLNDRIFGELNEKQAEYVGLVLKSSHHLHDLVNDILDLARVEAGRMELDLARVDPTSEIEGVLDLVQSEANRKNIELEWESGEKLPLISADGPKLKRMLYSLVENAVKFTPEGGRVSITAASIEDSPAPASAGEGSRLSTGSPAASRCLYISVTDTGPGISPDDQEKIFDAFHQSEACYTREHEGTGLGLALSRQLAELHGGTVRVRSGGAGKGSTFTIVLPIVDTVADRVPCQEGPTRFLVQKLARGVKMKPNRSPRILIVDDEEPTRELLRVHLEKGGYECVEAEDGQTALKSAEELRPAAITLDMHLPDMHGREVLKALKTNPATREIPVIVVSMDIPEEEVLEAGTIEWLVKPVKQKRLLEVLSQHLGPAETVLVADDQPMLVEILTETLQSAGFKVVQAYGGQQAIGLALDRMADAIILDLQMPDMDGFAVVRELRHSHRYLQRTGPVPQPAEGTRLPGGPDQSGFKIHPRGLARETRGTRVVRK